MKLLSINNDAKTSKGIKRGWLTAILYLAPDTTAKLGTVCPKSTPGCRESCLFTAGRGQFDTVRAARIARTGLLLRHAEQFYEQLREELSAFKQRAQRQGLRPCARLNGTSDLPKMAMRMAREFPDIMFYDYTKIPRPWDRELSNYKLTFSRSETNERDWVEAFEHNINVAMVFAKPMKHDNGFMLSGSLALNLINGDQDDLRFLDPRPCIVALKAKGRARKDTTGFVVR